MPRLIRIRRDLEVELMVGWGSFFEAAHYATPSQYCAPNLITSESILSLTCCCIFDNPTENEEMGIILAILQD